MIEFSKSIGYKINLSKINYVSVKLDWNTFQNQRYNNIYNHSKIIKFFSIILTTHIQNLCAERYKLCLKKSKQI
jgi:hypothetical protein